MKVLFLGSSLLIKVVPRVYPQITDTLVLRLRNEITGIILTPEINFSVGQTLDVTLLNPQTDFKVQNKYEIEISNDGWVIYRGKLIILEDGTDVQTYNYGQESNSRFNFK